MSSLMLVDKAPGTLNVDAHCTALVLALLSWKLSFLVSNPFSYTWGTLWGTVAFLVVDPPQDPPPLAMLFLYHWYSFPLLVSSPQRMLPTVTANNKLIDPNSLRRHIDFCLLQVVERDKHWVSRWYLTVLYFCPHHYGTARHPQSCEITYVGHAIYQNTIEYKKYRKHRVMNSCAMESVWLTRHK